MVSHRHGATGTVGHIAAVTALDYWCAPPAIEKQDGLLPRFHAISQALGQPAAENAAVSITQLLAHIAYLYMGQL